MTSLIIPLVGQASCQGIAMPGATGAAGWACQQAVKTMTRDHFCSNKHRGAREETAAARIFQKHPLEKGNR